MRIIRKIIPSSFGDYRPRIRMLMFLGWGVKERVISFGSFETIEKANQAMDKYLLSLK